MSYLSIQQRLICGGAKNNRHENAGHEIVGQVHSSEAANREVE